MHEYLVMPNGLLMDIIHSQIIESLTKEKTMLKSELDKVNEQLKVAGKGSDGKLKLTFLM